MKIDEFGQSAQCTDPSKRSPGARDERSRIVLGTRFRRMIPCASLFATRRIAAIGAIEPSHVASMSSYCCPLERPWRRASELAELGRVKEMDQKLKPRRSERPITFSVDRPLLDDPMAVFYFPLRQWNL